jgi:hypothetical protein
MENKQTGGLQVLAPGREEWKFAQVSNQLFRFLPLTMCSLARLTMDISNLGFCTGRKSGHGAFG